MLQRSGEALYSSCAGDKPRTCSATICVVISKCTRRCSRSSLLIEAWQRVAEDRQTVNVRIVQPRNRCEHSVFVVRCMGVGSSEPITWTPGAEEGHHRSVLAAPPGFA